MEDDIQRFLRYADDPYLNSYIYIHVWFRAQLKNLLQYAANICQQLVARNAELQAYQEIVKKLEYSNSEFKEEFRVAAAQARAKISELQAEASKLQKERNQLEQRYKDLEKKLRLHQKLSDSLWKFAKDQLDTFYGWLCRHKIVVNGKPTIEEVGEFLNVHAPETIVRQM